jgi:hypothetical protein
MSNVKVLDLDLRDDNMVFAATHGRGVFSGQFSAESLAVKTQLFSSSKIKVYPTVSKGELKIISQRNIGKTEINIYNLSGQNIHSEVINLSTIESTLNATHLSSGMYLMKFSNENKNITHKFLIE